MEAELASTEAELISKTADLTERTRLHRSNKLHGRRRKSSRKTIRSTVSSVASHLGKEGNLDECNDGVR